MVDFLQLVISVINWWMDVDECSKTWRWQFINLCSLSLSRYDYVEIHDGNSESADLLGKHCSNIAPAPIISSGPSLHIKFVSDYAHQEAGFSLRYEIFKTGNWMLNIMCYCNVALLIEVFHGFIAKAYTEPLAMLQRGWQMWSFKSRHTKRHLDNNCQLEFNMWHLYALKSLFFC